MRKILGACYVLEFTMGFMKKFLYLFLLVSLFTTNAFAHSEEEELEIYVRKLISDGYSLFNDEKIPVAKRNKRIKELLNENLNLDWMARYSLGRHRRTLDENKIEEFARTYSKFVVKAYVDLTQHYSGEKAKLKTVKQIDEDMFIVNLEIIKPGSNSPIKVDYLVHEIGNGKDHKFKVGDIITEGISLLNSQQSEFNSIISNQGIDALIKNLEEKSTTTEIDPSAIRKTRY